MTEDRFIELLNLYLDHQIEPAEVAELEGEVRTNPVRRATYTQYCRLQRGCNLLGSQAHDAAPASARFARSLADAERKIATPHRAFTWSPFQVGSGVTLALAASVAIVVILRSPQSTSPAVAVINAPSTDVARMEIGAGAVATPALASLNSFVPQSALMAVNLGAGLAMEESDNTTTDQEVLAWMQRVDQLQRQALVVDEQAFAGRAMVPPDTGIVRRQYSQQASTELTHFTLQR